MRVKADVAQLDDAPTAGAAPIAQSSRALARRSDGPRLLEPAPGGPAERFAVTVGAQQPVRVFLVAVLAGYAALVVASIALGFFLTQVLLRLDALASWDERASRRLAQGRTETLVDLSWAGSTLAGGVVIPTLVGVLLLVFLLGHRWRLAAFTLFVICVESGAYRTTTLVVHRDRPEVDRLESLPVDASFPSGHTAASVALFGGLLLVLASRVESLAVRIALWSLVVAIPAFVLWSRLLRGMHHTTDVAAGVLLGIGALVITVFAARAAGAAAARRDAAERPCPDETMKEIDR